MKMSLPEGQLREYVASQCASFFPDGSANGKDSASVSALGDALMRTEECLRHITIPGYSANGQALFSHLHSDQYATFLYFFSNCLWKSAENEEYAKRVRYLNQALNGFYVSYKCALPEHFVFGHPTGSVIGNASYGDCCVFFQNVTVNTGHKTDAELTPVIGKGLFCAAGSKIIGTKPIGDRVSIGVDACVYGQEIPHDSIVVNDGEKTLVRPRKSAECQAQDFFDIVL